MQRMQRPLPLGHPTDVPPPVNGEAKRKSTDEGAHWDQLFVLGSGFIFHPSTQMAKSNASLLAHTSVWIIQTSLYYRPYMFHDGRHVFTAAFDRHTESKHRATTEIRIWGLEILLNKSPKRGEDLGRGENRGQTINYSQC